MNTLPQVANEGGKYGEIIKAELRTRPTVSYTKLEQMFDAAGITTPDGQRIKRSRIFAYADDQNTTPDWFMLAFGRVFHGDPDWWRRKEAELTRLGASVVASHRLPLIRTSSAEPGDTIEVRGAPSGGMLTAVQVENDLARPAFRDTDLVLIDTGSRKPTEMRVYATLEGKAVVFRKAEWDNAQDRLVLKAARGRLEPLEASKARVLGMAVVRYDRFRVGDLPRGAFDFEGYLFGEDW